MMSRKSFPPRQCARLGQKFNDVRVLFAESERQGRFVRSRIPDGYGGSVKTRRR
jgi:hypothetical protein